MALFGVGKALDAQVASRDGLSGSRVGLSLKLVAAGTIFLALALLLLFFFLFDWTSLFKSGAGQKKLTEKPPVVDLAVHIASSSLKQLC